MNAGGSITSGSTITAQSGVTATTGNFTATTGNMSAAGTVTAGAGVTVSAGTVTTPSVTTPLIQVAASTALALKQNTTQIIGWDTGGNLTVGPTSGHIGFYGVTPVAKAAAITQLTNTATGTQIATAVNAIIVALQNLGLTS
jgi:hypothetical protein